MSDIRSYHSRRAQEERQRALAATDERARQPHLDMARYHELRARIGEVANDVEAQSAVD